MAVPDETRRQDLNRRLETLSWGLFLVMLGGLALARDVPQWTWLLGTGVIMIGLNAVRLLLGIRASWFTVLLGTFAVLAGLGSVLGVALPILPLMIILIGAAIIVRAVQPRS